MPLIRRVRDLLSANLNEMVDRLEDPEKLMKHAVREMEATLHSATSAAARSIAAERMLEREISKCRERSQSAYDRAGRLIHAGDEDTARRVLAKKCRIDRQFEILSSDRDRAQENNAELRQRIEQMQNRLVEARQACATAVARQRVAEARRQFSQATATTTTDFEIVARFERLRTRVASAEAEADAWVDLTSTGLDTTDESDEALETAASVERMLVELRAVQPPVN